MPTSCSPSCSAPSIAANLHEPWPYPALSRTAAAVLAPETAGRLPAWASPWDSGAEFDVNSRATVCVFLCTIPRSTQRPGIGPGGRADMGRNSPCSTRAAGLRAFTGEPMALRRRRARARERGTIANVEITPVRHDRETAARSRSVGGLWKALPSPAAVRRFLRGPGRLARGGAAASARIIVAARPRCDFDRWRCSGVSVHCARQHATPS